MIDDKWFHSYLSNRGQQVYVNGILSSNICKVKHGTPQGSILGPLLFIIFINDLPNCLEHSTPLFYADDTNLLISGKDCNDLVKKGNEELENISNWLRSNMLSLNVTKTQAVLFRTPNTRIPTNMSKLFLTGHELTLADSTEFLGVTITKSLSWKKHMISLKSKLRRNTGVCRKIKNQVGPGAMLNLYHSMIAGHVRRDIATWCHGNTSLKNTIENICQRFLKMTLPHANSNNIHDMMAINQIMTVDQILFYEIAIIMFKIHNDIFPECFKSFFVPTMHQMTTRSRRCFSFDKPRIQLTKQALNYKGTIIWNNLPNDVKYSNNDNSRSSFKSLNAFKKSLKNFIINSGSMEISFILSQIINPRFY